MQQTPLLLDSPQPLAPRVLVQRRHLVSTKDLLPLGRLLLVPLPSVSPLPLVNLPSPSLPTGVQLRIMQGFLPLLGQGHQRSHPLRPILLPPPDQFSDSLRSAVLVAECKQVNQHLVPPILPRQVQPLEDLAPLAQRQSSDLGKRLLSESPITQPLLSDKLCPLQLQHLHPRHPLRPRQHRHSASLRQMPRQLVNQRQYLASIHPPLLPSVNQPLPLVRQRQLNSQHLAKLSR